jgi:signal transduction histidine kinase
MSKKSISHIFEKFYRAEDTLTAKTKGYGLGLSIVKNLVDLNNGTVSVNSKEGEGSTFTVTFPIIQETVKKEQQAEALNPIPTLVNSSNNTTDYAKN